MNKFKVGDIVESKTNTVWTGPMEVREAPNDRSKHLIYSCYHPNRSTGVGGFHENELKLHQKTKNIAKIKAFLNS